jgi:hypothetical protein
MRFESKIQEKRAELLKSRIKYEWRTVVTRKTGYISCLNGTISLSIMADVDARPIIIHRFRRGPGLAGSY